MGRATKRGAWGGGALAAGVIASAACTSGLDGLHVVPSGSGGGIRGGSGSGGSGGSSSGSSSGGSSSIGSGGSSSGGGGSSSGGSSGSSGNSSGGSSSSGSSGSSGSGGSTCPSSFGFSSSKATWTLKEGQTGSKTALVLPFALGGLAPTSVITTVSGAPGWVAVPAHPDAATLTLEAAPSVPYDAFPTPAFDVTIALQGAPECASTAHVTPAITNVPHLAIELGGTVSGVQWAAYQPAHQRFVMMAVAPPRLFFLDVSAAAPVVKGPIALPFASAMAGPMAATDAGVYVLDGDTLHRLGPDGTDTANSLAVGVPVGSFDKVSIAAGIVASEGWVAIGHSQGPGVVVRDAGGAPDMTLLPANARNVRSDGATSFAFQTAGSGSMLDQYRVDAPTFQGAFCETVNEPGPPATLGTALAIESGVSASGWIVSQFAIDGGCIPGAGFPIGSGATSTGHLALTPTRVLTIPAESTTIDFALFDRVTGQIVGDPLAGQPITGGVRDIVAGGEAWGLVVAYTPLLLRL